MSLTAPGSGCRGLPTAALAISQRTVGEFLDSANLAKLDSSLRSRLTRAVTLFLMDLYLGPWPKESLHAISASVGAEVQGERLDRDPLNGGGQVHAVDNPLVNERKDGVWVLDPVDVGPGPGFKRSIKSSGQDLLEVPLLDGLVGGGQHVNHHGSEQRVVVRGVVVDHVNSGHKVLGHTHGVEDELVLPRFAVFPHVPAVGPVHDACLQVPHVGLRHRGVVS
jgi:hypothetical protein